MKSIYLEGVYSGYEVDRWITRNHAKLIRCVYNEKGAVVYYIGVDNVRADDTGGG